MRVIKSRAITSSGLSGLGVINFLSEVDKKWMRLICHLSLRTVRCEFCLLFFVLGRVPSNQSRNIGKLLLYPQQYQYQLCLAQTSPSDPRLTEVTKRISSPSLCSWEDDLWCRIILYEARPSSPSTKFHWTRTDCPETGAVEIRNTSSQHRALFDSWIHRGQCVVFILRQAG